MKYSAGLVVVAAVCLVLVLVTTTNPSSAGPLGVLAFFVLLYIGIVGAIYIVLDIVTSLLMRVLKPGALKVNLQEMTTWRLYYYASTLALAPIILLGLQSVGGGNLTSVGLVLLFEVIACFYIYKRF